MKHQTFLVLFLLSLISFACNGYKILFHEKQADNKEFYFNSVDYFGKNCSEFSGVIRDRKKVMENIVFYNCSSLSPVKILYTYDSKGKVKNTEYFISVTDDEFEFTLTEDEKYLFQVIDNKNRKTNYQNYSRIKGFRRATERDNIFSIPTISKANKRK